MASLGGLPSRLFKGTDNGHYCSNQWVGAENVVALRFGTEGEDISLKEQTYNNEYLDLP